MTYKAIQARIDAIRATAANGDFETAHAAEDALYLDVLKAISKGDAAYYYAVTLARRALETQDITFRRVTS